MEEIADDHEQRDSDLPTGLSKPARRALDHAGYTRLEQLAQMTERELLQLHGIGPQSIPLFRQALAVKGLAFAENGGSV